MTQFKEGDLVQYNPERVDTTFVEDAHPYGGRLLGLVVEISTVHIADWNHVVPPGHTVIGVSWPDAYMEEDPEDLLKVTEDDSV